MRLHLYSAGQFPALGNSMWAGHNYAGAARRRATEGRYIEAMRLRHAAHDTAAVAGSYGAIGQIYLEQQNLPAAQVAHEQSLRAGLLRCRCCAGSKPRSTPGCPAT